MNKIPKLGLLYWIMKIAATTLGETGGDLVSMTMNLGYAVSTALFMGFFLVTVLAQLKIKTYNPALFWMVILATSTAGTTMSDFMDRTMDLGYAMGSALLITILAGVFAYWRSTGESLSVVEIRTTRVEIMYWTAILFSNTLGTALGDFIADESGLGFAGGAALISAALAIIVALYYFTNVSRVFLFWAAFVLTRPFGATMGDTLTKSYEKGGMNLGTIGTSAVLGGILLVLTIYEIVTLPKQKAQVAV